jgi:hypothetical protein
MELLLALVVIYAAYRIIRGGFTRSASTRLGWFGVIGYLVLILLAASFISSLIDR